MIGAISCWSRALVVSAGALAQDAQPTTNADGVVLRGISTRFVIEHQGCELRALPLDSLRAPLSVSVTAESPGVWAIDVIGIVPGGYDLAEFVECADGARIDMPPVSVRVVSALPPGRHIDLAGAEREALVSPARSRSWAARAVIAWAVISLVWLVLFFVRRVSDARQPESDPPAQDPHLLLIEAVGTRPMTVAERGRLELLTLRAMGRRHLRANPGSPLELYTELRREPEAAPLIEALERWLHRPDAGHDEGDALRSMLRERFSRQPQSGESP